MTVVAEGPGQVEAIATGLLEVDEDQVTDHLTRYQGTTFVPGQRLRVDPTDPTVMELVRADQLQLVSDLPHPEWWQAPGRVLQCEPGRGTVQATAPSAGSLRIVSGTGYDPGACAYRTHSALNECSPHASAFVRHITKTTNPHDCPTQYRLPDDTALVRALILEADVVHYHVDTLLSRNVGLAPRPRQGQIVLRHYHGTQFDATDTVAPDAGQQSVKDAEKDDWNGYVLVAARLQICALRPGRIQWLPIPVPVARYAAMVRKVEGGPFRIAHSPTRRRLKGTDTFLAVCARLYARGVLVEPVLIEQVSHAESLRIKAMCDATFDSFALGIQGSGLEGAAMGQPVIAGDAHVRDLYQEHIGSCPYTFANDAWQLEEQIERLATDPAFRAAETARVGNYVRQYHDYAAVAARYSQIVTEAA